MKFSIVAMMLIFTPFFGTYADEITKAEETIKTLEAQKRVLLLKKELVELNLDIATTEESISKKRRAIAVEVAATEEAKRLIGLPEMIINFGRISQVSDKQRYCDATSFLKYTCHKTASCPVFEVDDSLCGKPSINNEHMMLEVNYSCGTEQRSDLIPFGANAYLSCK